MNPSNLMDEAVTAVQEEQYAPDAIANLQASIHAKLNAIDRATQPSEQRLHRRYMLKLAGLGAVAAGAAFFAFDPFGAYSSKSLFAQAVENLRHGDLYYVLTKQGNPVSFETWVAADGRRRDVLPTLVTVSDKFGNPLMFYTTNEADEKVAGVCKILSRTTPIRFEDAWLKCIIDGSGANLIGEERGEDGSTTEHYRVTSEYPKLIFDVWIDPKSKSFVRVEFEETRKDVDSRMLGKYTITHIKCNQRFDESLFDATPPKGYRVVIIDKPTTMDGRALAP